MKINNFKWALENLTDATWKQYVENYDDSICLNRTMEQLASEYDTADDVLMDSFTFQKTLEGFHFWHAQVSKLFNLTDRVIEEAKVKHGYNSDSEVGLSSQNAEDEWSCGCNILGGHTCGKQQGDRSAGMKFPIRSE